MYEHYVIKAVDAFVKARYGDAFIRNGDIKHDVITYDSVDQTGSHFLRLCVAVPDIVENSYLFVVDNKTGHCVPLKKEI